MGMVFPPITLTIASGSTTSNIISGSDLQEMTEVTAFGPTALDGSFILLELSPTLSTGSLTFLPLAEEHSTAPGKPHKEHVEIHPLQASLISPLPPAAGYRVASDSVESADRNVIFIGKQRCVARVMPTQDIIPISFADLGS